MDININTKFITLIGTPLTQSFAARMQNAAYKAAGLNLKYFYTEMDEEHLGEVIQGIKYMPSFIGCAVTKPNKVKVLEYLDDLDPLCRMMGACNTVVKRDGKLIGYNTDGLGFIRAFEKETELDVETSSFFCIGSGGAGRAICFALAYHGAQKIYITDIFDASAAKMTEDLNAAFPGRAEHIAYGEYEKSSSCTAVINASGIGMGSTIGQSPLPTEYIRKGQIFFDACYNPDKTQFLLNAEDRGCRILNGLGMSLYQGVAQIELWTGKEAPVDVMRQELQTILKEQADKESWDIPYTSHEDVITNRRDETTDDAKLAWKKVREEHIVRDEWIDFRKVAYEFPDGTVFSPYYNYSRKSYVVVLATDVDGNVLCVRQYRHGIAKVTTEFPAGGIETHEEAEYITADDKHVEPESAYEAAVRELREETGYVSDDWTHLITVPSDATLADNYAYVYVARNCRKVSGVNLDGTEFLNVILHTPQEIDRMIEEEKFDQAVHVLAWELMKNRMKAQ